MIKWLRKWWGRAQHEFEEEMEKRAHVSTPEERQRHVERHEMIERRLRERFTDPSTGKFKVQS